MANSYSKLATMPVEEDAPKGASRILAMPVDAETKTEETLPWWKRAAHELVDPKAWKHSLGVIARGAIQGIEAPLTIPADFGVAVRNAITGEDTPTLSELRDQDLDAIGLARPESKLEKVNSFVASVLAGAGTPMPSVRNPAPAGFVKPSASPAESVLKTSRDAGYVVPPSTAKPNMVNKLVESISGKAATAQEASIRNQELTNELARKALGLSSGAPITKDSLKGIREAAGKIYAQIADAGEIRADDQFLTDLASLGRGADEISKAFPGANVGATKQIGELVDSLLQPSFDSKAALQYLRELRKSASGNLSGMNVADPAKAALGMAQKEAAGTLEDLIGRHLSANGMDDVAQSFAQARKAIAVSHTVEKALNETTGNVVAGKLGQQLAKGKPLTDELEIIAQFSRAFPKAAKEITESMPGISPLDWYASGTASFLTGNVAPMAAPFARIGARKALLGPLGQGTLEMPDFLKMAPRATIPLLMQSGHSSEDEEE